MCVCVCALEPHNSVTCKQCMLKQALHAPHILSPLSPSLFRNSLTHSPTTKIYIYTDSIYTTYMILQVLCGCTDLQVVCTDWVFG